jgi:hypothetical protein
MAVTYANSRIVLPSSCWDVISTTGGQLTAKNLYFSLQTENRVGRNLLLISPVINILDSGKITITINSQAKLPAEEIFNYVIGASISANPNTFSQIAKLPVTNSTVFPIILEITKDIFLRTGYITSDDISLISQSDLLHGMLVGYRGTGLIYEYDNFDSTSTIDNQLVLLAGSNKRFKARGSFSTYISSVYDIDGSRIDLRESGDITSILGSYNANGSDSSSIRLWLDNPSGSVSVGTRITLIVKINELIKTNLFDKKIHYIFEGIVNLDTCELRTTKKDGITPFEKLGIPLVFNSNAPNFSLEEDLEIGEALSFSFYLNFLGAEINDFLPEKAVISIYPSFVSNIGSYVPGSDVIGDCIFPDEGRRRVLPSTTISGLEILNGSGLIKNYTFPLLPKITILGLIPNTDNQKVFISNLGNCFIAPTNTPNNSAIRAFVSTKSGETNTTNWSSYISITQNSNFTLTLTLPTSIRPTYPDVIATTSSTFSIAKYVIYIQKQSNSEIRKFEIEFNSNIVDNKYTITLQDWNNGQIVTSLPINNDSNFNLYNVPYFVINSGLGSGFVIGSYRFCISYLYDGNQVTSISHDVSRGCIIELDMPLSQALNNMKYLGEPLFKEQLLSLDTTYIPDGQRRSLKGTNNDYLDLVFYKYQTGEGNNVSTYKPGEATTPGIWKEKESGLNLDQVSQYVYSSIFPNISTLNDFIKSVDEGIIPLILALGGSGSNKDNGTTTTIPSTEYPLITVNASSITPNLEMSDKYLFTNTGTRSSINNALNISSGDKFTIQTNNTGTYLFGSNYYLPEGFTSVTLEGKSTIEAIHRGTSTDIMIYSVW